MSQPIVVPVALGARSYEIAIGPGLLAEAGQRISALAPKARLAIVTDANVAALHLATLTASLDAAGLEHQTITVAPGEASKSFATFAEVCEGLIATRVERGDLVVAFGGGVIGDLAGFAAAAVRRGMRFVQIPTSLLAQVDSSVGGKTGINSRHGKNLVGAFHQPSLVLADTQVLDTLSRREFRAGYAEVAKYGLINDAPFFHWLENNWQDVMAGGPARVEAIATSCRSKAGIVARDETETGERALLISATPSAMRWKRSPATIPPAWCMAKAFRSAWFWPMNSRPGSACARRKRPRASPPILPQPACPPASTKCRAAPARRAS